MRRFWLSHPGRRGPDRPPSPMALYWFLDARFYESTDDAYVGGNVVAITSRENATVHGAACRQHPDGETGPAADRDGPRRRQCEPAGGRGQSGARGAHRARRILQRRCLSRPADPGAGGAGPGAGRLSAPPEGLRRRRRCRAKSWPMPATRWRRPRPRVNTAQGGLEQTTAASRRHRCRPQSRCAGGRSAAAQRRHRAAAICASSRRWTA